MQGTTYSGILPDNTIFDWLRLVSPVTSVPTPTCHLLLNHWLGQETNVFAKSAETAPSAGDGNMHIQMYKYEAGSIHKKKREREGL